MSQLMRIGRAWARPCWRPRAAGRRELAEAEGWSCRGTAAQAATLDAADGAAVARAARSPLGLAAASMRAGWPRSRGGAADVYNDMQLKGVVADNQAINVTTGHNAITDGSFANASGVPMVVQNSGNNVLIQNATIVNVQVK